MRHDTVPLDLTSGSKFATVIWKIQNESVTKSIQNNERLNIKEESASIMFVISECANPHCGLLNHST